MEFLSRQTVRLPRWAIFVSPGRIHLTGCHVGDIAAERDGDVPGRGGGPAEMDGDVLRDDDPVQHPRHTGEGNLSRNTRKCLNSLTEATAGRIILAERPLRSGFL